MAIEQVVRGIHEQLAHISTESEQQAIAETMAESMRDARLFFDLIADPDLITSLLNTSNSLNPAIRLGNYKRGDQNKVEDISLVIQTMTKEGDKLASIMPIEPYLLAVIAYTYDDLQTSVENREGCQTEALTKAFLEKTSPDYNWSIQKPDKSDKKNDDYQPRAYYIGKRNLTPELLAGAHGQNIARMAETIKNILPSQTQEK